MKLLISLLALLLLSSLQSFAKSKENINDVIKNMPTHVRAFMSSDLNALEININKYAKSAKLSIVNSSISHIKSNDNRFSEFTALVTFKRL